MAYNHTLEVRYNEHQINAEVDFENKDIKFADESEMPMNMLGKIYTMCKNCCEILGNCADLKSFEITKKK